MLRTLVCSFCFVGASLSLLAQPRITSVVHGADFSATLAPGSLATIFGTGFSTDLAVVSVSIGGRTAPLTFGNAMQINFQVPLTVAPGPASVTVAVGGQTSAAFPFSAAATAPGIFQYGAKRGVVQNQDYSLNSATNPASAGSTVIVYLTGIGVTNPPVGDGMLSPSSPLAIPSVSSSATIAGQDARVQFIGLTPGNIGLAQANVTVPAIQATGDFPLVVAVGGIPSTSVLISVRGDERAGLPEGVSCISGTVERVVLSREKELQGMADEIVIGTTTLCPACDQKPPVYAPFVKLIDRARKARLAVDACFDGFGTINYLRLRR